jgi:DNA polymerase III delta subunit
MILAALMKQIQSNELQPYYIFECEDRTISDMYLANMEKCGLKRIVVDDTLTALKNNSAGSLLKQQRKLFIIRDDKSVTTNDKIWPLIKSVKNATFVFIFTTIDKRTQFYKQFEDNIVTFSKLRADVLAKHLKSKSNITDVQLKELIKLTDNCYGYALSELDKVCGYAQASDLSDSEAYQLLRSNHMIGNEPNDNLFRAIDAMLNGDIHRTYLYLKDEEPVSTLAAMFSSIKQLWLVRCYGRNEVLKEFGINDMQININLGRRTIYNNNQLKRLLMFSIDVEQKMKFGIIPMENAIDYFVSHAMTI